MNKYIIFGFLILIFGFTAQAVAVPQYLNYQGVLRDNYGNLVNGTRPMTFRVYDSFTNGNKLWEMTVASVPVGNGLYNVKLGPLGADVLGTGSRWMELAVGDAILSPRLEILGVAYAVTADMANYATLSGTATTAANALTVGGYNVGVSGGSIVPTTDAFGKLAASIIPSSGGGVAHADTADYATLSGTASNTAHTDMADYATLSGTATNAAQLNNQLATYYTNASNLNAGTVPSDRLTGTYAINITGDAHTVDTYHASTTAENNKILVLDGNKRLNGMAVSAEASSGNFAMFIGGRVGAKTGNGFCAGTGTILLTGNSATITNSAVTTNSIILITVGHGAAPASDNTGETIKVSAVVPGQFTVKTVSQTNPSANLPFGYLIIN